MGRNAVGFIPRVLSVSTSGLEFQARAAAGEWGGAGQSSCGAKASQSQGKTIGPEVMHHE